MKERKESIAIGASERTRKYADAYCPKAYCLSGEIGSEFYRCDRYLKKSTCLKMYLCCIIVQDQHCNMVVELKN